MENLRNERGVALVTSLMLTLIALAIILAVLYYVFIGTQHSAAYRRYNNVLEATNGGVEFFSKELIPQIFAGSGAASLVSSYPGLSLNFGTYTSCLKQKLNNPTAKWGTTICGPNATISDPKIAPDVTFKLNGLPTQPRFNVYAKIVDTVPGNSDTSLSGSSGSAGGYLLGGGGVAYGGSGSGSGSGSVAVMHVPALLTIEVAGERETNAKEKARLSVLYAY